MRWNAFNLITPAIDKTKKRLFPFQLKNWIKLIIISFLANSRGGNFNMNFPNSASGSENVSPTFQEVISKIRDYIKQHFLLIAIISSVVFLIGTLLSYIKSVFSFIFIDSLINTDIKFTFKKNQSKGLSLFLFKFVITLITLIVFICLSYPYIYHFMKANPIIESVGIPYIIFSITAFVLYSLILGVMLMFLEDFVVPYMYSKNVPALFAFKTTWKEILKNKLEVFVFWLASLVIALAIAMGTFIVVLLLLLMVGAAGGIVFLLGFLLYKLIGGITIFTILAITLGVILILIWIITCLFVCLIPSVFFRYFQLFNFEKLTKIKLLTKL